jgi:hypothetical protein
MSAVIPTLSARVNSKMIIVSTPKGTNHFYDLWRKSVDGTTTYVPIKVNWYEVPGKDEKWKRQMIADLGPTRFAQEYGCCSKDTPITIQDFTGKIIKSTFGKLFTKLKGK